MATPEKIPLTVKLVRALPLPVILLTATGLRFYRLAGQSLWSDEGNSVALAHRTFTEIARHTAFDIHPPLYYWLLKIWIALFGDSEIGLRSLSAVLGVGLVYLTWLLGRRIFGHRVGLLAALLAAVSPFQIHYAQEARMYMLLTFLGLITITAAVFLIAPRPNQHRYTNIVVVGMYIAAVTGGLYTHYAFPLILIATNIGALACLWSNRQLQSSKLWSWLSLQLIPLLMYLPWLPIAWRQLTTWPSEPQTASLPIILQSISKTLLVGLAWPYQQESLIAAGLALMLLPSIPATRIVSQKNKNLRPIMAILWFWFLLPVMLTVMIFSPAFLKFLLTATPPLTLLTALAIDDAARLFRHRIAGVVVGGGLISLWLGLSAGGLGHYYANPQYARDNYRGIVTFIKAVAHPTDAVILNAEGQQDVFNYYYQQLPRLEAAVYPLPQQRPLNEAATIATLEEITAETEKLYAVYWAAQQADPAGLIEGWLNEHLFKATDRWYGNVRLVSYANLRQGEPIAQIPADFRLGESIRLTGYGLADSAIAPGDILQVGLTWQTDTLPTDNYTVFLQLLDPVNHLVGQRDSAPLTPTITWTAGESIADQHGLFVEPGTPPGPHRLIAGLYHSQTGQRLPVNTGADFVELGMVKVMKPEIPLPVEAFEIQNPQVVSMENISLLGYDLHKLGYRSQPETPLHPGDPLHLTLYWQANQPAYPAKNELILGIISTNGKKTGVAATTTPAGVDYPVENWRPGEIVRGQFDLFLTGLAPGEYQVVIKLREKGIATRPFGVE